MKKFIAVIALVVSVATLSGCMHKADEARLNEEEYPGYVFVYTDKESGCEYLIWHDGNAGGITPRLNEDGTVKVVK